MVVQVHIALQVGINHLPNRRRPICTTNQPSSIPAFTCPSNHHLKSKLRLTRKSHHLGRPPLLHKPLLKQLHLRRLAAAVQALEHNKCAPPLGPAAAVFRMALVGRSGAGDGGRGEVVDGRHFLSCLFYFLLFYALIMMVLSFLRYPSL